MSDQPQPSQAVVLRREMSVGQALGVDEILAQVKLIQDVMHRVMVEKEHYGTIPGCGDKKTLLQPGAQKLTMTFRLAPEYDIQEVNLERGHKEYRVTCTLKSIQSGTFVGQGVGCCSTMESKYRWRQASRKCPNCGKEGTVIKGKAEYGGGWLCYAKKGGCGQKWPDGELSIESQKEESSENDNPADCYNTVLKMAKKRAFVDATITATAASDIFTQDIGDDDSPADDGYLTKTEPTKPVEASKPVYATAATRKWMIAKLSGCPTEATEYCRKAGMLLDTESLEDLPLRFVPVSNEQLVLLCKAIGRFASGDPAEPAFPPNPEKPEKSAKTIEVPRDKQVDATQDDPNHPEAAWRTFPMPWGKEAGVPLAELDKKYLYGLWANYVVENEYNGKPKSADNIAKDRKFREMLDAAGEHYQFTNKD